MSDLTVVAKNTEFVTAWGRIRSCWGHLALSTTSVILVYAPLAARRSAWSDDYPQLESGNFTKLYSDLRPLWGVLHELVFPTNIESLLWIRLIGVLGAGILASYLTYHFILWGTGRILSVFLGVSICLLPPFHEYLGWATFFSLPWIALLGGASGLLWIDSRAGGRSGAAVVAFLGILIALLSYPAGALFCWALLGLRFAATRSNLSKIVREVRLLMVLTVLAGAAAYGTARVVIELRTIDIDPRVGVVSSITEGFEKLVWFVTHPVVVAARVFQIRSPGPIEALITGGPILLIIIVGFYYRFPNSRFDRVVSLVVCLFVGSMAMAAHLISHDNQISYRFMLGLVVVIWVYLVFAVTTLAERFIPLVPKEGPTWLLLIQRHSAKIAMAGILVFGAVGARSNIDTTFVAPFESKHQYLEARLANFDTTHHEQIIIVNDMTLWPTRPNLGIFSVVSDLAHPWVVEPNLRLVLAEMDLDISELDIDVYSTLPSPVPGQFILDVRPYALQLASGRP